MLAMFLLPAALAATDLPGPADLREDLVAALDTRRGLLRDRSDQRNLLSETHTLLMELDLALGDAEAFAEDVALLERYFLADNGLLRWRLGRPDRGFCTDATVDDLRAVRVLLAAADRWNDPALRALGERIGAAVVAHASRDGVLVDAASWPCGRRAPPSDPVPGTYLTLSFADTCALVPLIPRCGGAWDVHVLTSPIVYAGLLDPAGPRSGHDLTTGAYDLREDNPINRELLRLHMLGGCHNAAWQAPVCTQQDDAWRTSESVAHIALAARRLAHCDHTAESEQAIAHMGTFLLEDGPWAGLFGYEIDGDTIIWAFDNLQAGLALAERVR
ncbi:MAG: hypothetical protein ABIO70_02105 [Pseudomonadota bacterium]